MHVGNVRLGSNRRMSGDHMRSTWDQVSDHFPVVSALIP